MSHSLGVTTGFTDVTLVGEDTYRWLYWCDPDDPDDNDDSDDNHDNDDNDDHDDHDAHDDNHDNDDNDGDGKSYWVIKCFQVIQERR